MEQVISGQVAADQMTEAQNESKQNNASASATVTQLWTKQLKPKYVYKKHNSNNNNNNNSKMILRVGNDGERMPSTQFRRKIMTLISLVYIVLNLHSPNSCFVLAAPRTGATPSGNYQRAAPVKQGNALHRSTNVGTSSQFADSIYKVAPLLFGADIIQDYFNSETGSARQASEPVRALTPAKAQVKQTRPLTSSSSSATTTSASTVALSSKSRGREARIAGKRRKQPARLPPTFDFDVSNSEPQQVVELTDHALKVAPQQQQQQAQTIDSSVPEPSSGLDTSMQSSDFGAELQAEHMDALVAASQPPPPPPQPQAQQQQQQQQQQSSQATNEGDETDVAAAVTPTLPLQSDNVETTNSAAASSSGPAAPAVSMDQVLSSLGLVVEAMKQQTMAMRMISERQMSAAAAAAAAAVAAADAKTTSTPATTGAELPATQMAPQAANAQQRQQQQQQANNTITTTTIGAQTSQAEARALLESFGELMSGFRSARAAKQVMLELVPALLLQSGAGTKGGSSDERLVLNLQEMLEAGKVAQEQTSNGAIKQISSTSAATTAASTSQSPSSLASTITTTTTTTTTTPAPTQPPTPASTTAAAYSTSTTTTTTKAPSTSETSVETIPPFVVEMIAKQQGKARQQKQYAAESPSFDGLENIYTPAPSQSLLSKGWRQVKAMDYFPRSPQHQMSMASMMMNPAEHDQQQSSKQTSIGYGAQSMMQQDNFRSVGMPGYGGSSGGGRGHGSTIFDDLHEQSTTAAPMVGSHQLSVSSQYNSGDSGEQQQQQHNSMQQKLQHMMQMLEMQAQKPASLSPYKQPEAATMASVANMVASMVASANAAEQQQAMHQSNKAPKDSWAPMMLSLVQQQQQQHSGEMPTMPMAFNMPNSQNSQQTSSQTKSNQMKIMQQAVVQALAAAMMTNGGSGTNVKSNPLKIGEKPQFNMNNFQLLSPVDIGRNNNNSSSKEKEVMMSLVQNALEEMQANKKKAKNSDEMGELASEQSIKLSHDSEQDSDSDESTSTNNSGTGGNARGKSANGKTRPLPKQHHRPQQLPNHKVTSFSILGGRFRLTPQTKVLHAILEPSKQLLKHALSDFMGPASLPMMHVGQAPHQVVQAPGGKHKPVTKAPKKSHKASSSSKQRQSSGTSSSNGSTSASKLIAASERVAIGPSVLVTSSSSVQRAPSSRSVGREKLKKNDAVTKRKSSE